MLNRIAIIGRLTRDPESRTTGNDLTVTNFTVAVDRNFANNKGEKETDFIPVVTWRGLAETCGRYLTKGKLVAVEGRLQLRTYEGKDGSKRLAAEIVADNVQFLSPKSEGAGSENGYYPAEPAGDEITPMDDIPF